MAKVRRMVKTAWGRLDSTFSYNYCMISFLPEWVLDGKGEADGEDCVGVAWFYSFL